MGITLDMEQGITKITMVIMAGIFLTKKPILRAEKAYTARAVISGKSKIMMIAGTSALMFPSDESPPRRLRR